MNNWLSIPVFFLVAVAVGPTFFSSVQGSSKLEEKVVQNNSNAQGFLGKPAKMVGGYNQPRRVFINENLIDLPLNFSWNGIPKKPTDALSNWLNYGSIGEEAEQFYIGVQFERQMPHRYSGVRTEISNLRIFRKRNIKLYFLGPDGKTNTQFGPLSTALFIYKYQGNTKACIAYLSAPSSIKIEGFYCGSSGEKKSIRIPTCLINSVKIYEDAYWREPEKGMQERTPCSINDATKKAI